jgi:hypothetical protein
MQDLRKRAGELDKDKEKEREWEREKEKEKEKELEREKEKERAREQEKEREREREREHEKSFSRSSSYGATPTPSKPTPLNGDETKKLLGKAAAGGQLSSDELSKLIANLSKQQKKVSDSQGPTTSAGGNSQSFVSSFCASFFGSQTTKLGVVNGKKENMFPNMSQHFHSLFFISSRSISYLNSFFKVETMLS